MGRWLSQLTGMSARAWMWLIGLLMAGTLGGQEPPGGPTARSVVAQARSYLGGERKLEAIESLRYVGKIEYIPTGATSDITIMFARPLRHRTEVRSEGQVVITVLNDLESWVRIVDEEMGQELSFRYLSEREAALTKYITWENLNFYTGIEKLWGRKEYVGQEDLLGHVADVVMFHYDKNYEVKRYFDAKTGKLLATRLAGNVELRELGEIVVDGMRFPERVETYRDGELESRVRFERVEINPDLSEEIFEMQPLESREP